MISVVNLSMRFGGKILFKNVSVQFNPNHRYGLVGANGCGKSTFIKILIRDIISEAGEIYVPSQVRVGSLKQDHYLYEEEEILNVVLRGNVSLWHALEERNKLFQHEEFTEKECLLLEKLEKVIEDQGGYTAESEAAKLLEGLGINEEWHRRPLKLLSGGFKLRVLLAKLLFGKPDVLVLDEPTNHLDLISIKWLEGYLRQFPGTLIVSSHDRDFLNAICTDIADMDYGTLKLYKGNYEAFVERKALDREQKELMLEKHDKKRADLQGFIDRFGAKASKARQAQSKARLVEKIVDEMESIDVSPSSRLYPNIKFTPYRSSSATALTVKGISKAYGTKQVLNDVEFEVERGDRLAIIGKNGIGKSTLLEILTENKTADQGTFAWGFATRVAYFPQDHAREVEGNKSLLDWLSQTDPAIPQEKLRGALARVLFSGDTVNQSVKTLSGGETARLILAKMILQNPNVLIFDEPTNHLDMEAIEELTTALVDFPETILFVSHNRYFVSKVANRIIEIQPKKIHDFRGTYSEYVAMQEQDLLKATASLRQRETPKDKAANVSHEEQKKVRNAENQLKRKVTQAEEECAKLEGKIQKIEAILGVEGFYQRTSSEEQQKILDEKNQLEIALQTALATWEKLSLECPS